MPTEMAISRTLAENFDIASIFIQKKLLLSFRFETVSVINGQLITQLDSATKGSFISVKGRLN